MKVLFSTKKPTAFNNPFIRELSDSISLHNKRIDCLLEPELFWKDPDDTHVDILHVHWPEDLMGWTTFNGGELQKLKKHFLKWKNKVPIVLTVHNIISHKGNKLKNDLYKYIYKNVEHFVHMGQASIALLKQTYSLPQKTTHTVIPHLMYASYQTDMEQKKARKYLDIYADDFVVLAFGSIRNKQEKKLLLKMFKHLNQENKKLVVTRPVFSKFFLSRLIEHYIYDPEKRIEVFDKKISSQEVPYFFGSADIVFIQRVDSLNSGNLILGYCFQKVVVGPDVGVIGEILRKTGNPTFNPSDINTVVQAIEKAKILAQEGKGFENYAYATAKWNQKLVAKKYGRLYKSLITQSTITI